MPLTKQLDSSLLLLTIKSILFFILCHDNEVVDAAPCTTCSVSGTSMTRPDQPLNIQQPIPIDTCGTLDSFVQFIDDSTEDCVGIRTLGGLCGCPIQENACRLCASFSETPVLADPLKELNRESSTVLQQAPVGLALTCEFVDSVLQVQTENDEICLSLRETYQSQCSCVAREEGGQAEEAASVVEVEVTGSTASTITNDTMVTPITNPCSLCPNGGTPTELEKKIDIPDSPIPINTCGELNLAARFVDANSSDCVSGIQLLGPYCGCEIASNACQLCGPNESAKLPDKRLDWVLVDSFLDSVFDAYGIDRNAQNWFDNGDITCGMVETFFASEAVIDQDSEACFVNQLRREDCGCQPHPKLPVMLLSRRFAGILSFLVSVENWSPFPFVFVFFLLLFSRMHCCVIRDLL